MRALIKRSYGLLAIVSFLLVASWRNYQQQSEVVFQTFSSNNNTSVFADDSKQSIIIQQESKVNAVIGTLAVYEHEADDDNQRSEQQQNHLPDYVQKHCDLRIHSRSSNGTTGDDDNVDEKRRMVEWWPTNAIDWRRRAPIALVIGAKKAGTTSMFQSLLPFIAKPKMKELLYFIPHRFKGWTNNTTGNKVLVHQARHIMYNQRQDYPIQLLLQQNATQHAVSMEATPDYLLYSTYSAQAILCTIPWVKLVVILRHPIDRLFSHYNFLIDPNLVGWKHLPSFDEWIQQDILHLQNFGILPQNLTDLEAHFGSQQENNGWQKYQRTQIKRGERPVARSLYAIQLEEWFHHLRQVGKDPADCVKIILSTDLKERQDIVVKDIVNWIQIPTIPIVQQQQQQLQGPQHYHRGLQQQQEKIPLPPPPLQKQGAHDQQPKNSRPQKGGMVTKYTSPPMLEETRQKLEILFAPYNQRLYRLLGPDWEGIFD